MKKISGNIGGKVIIGYIVLMVIALASLAYMYRMVEGVTEGEEMNDVPRQKLYLVSNTQTLLYESEAMGQLLNMQEEDYTYFNETLDKARENIEALRHLAPTDEFRQKLDTIDMLIERKRKNTEALLEIWQEAGQDLYAKNIESELSRERAMVEEKGVKEQIITQKDTSVVITPKKRSFFQRLAEVFVPTSQDTSIVVSANEHLLKDSLLNTYNPNEEVAKTLRDIQSNVLSERQRIQQLLVERSSAIRYDSSLINVRINQILRDMEEEEMNTSLDRMQGRQEMLRQMSYLITFIAIVSLLVAIFFLILIGRDLLKSSYYRRQLESMNKSREQLILTISHDVRAPLSSIIGYAELLQRSKLTPQQHTYLQNMGVSSRHILALVNDLLDYERLETGQIEMHQIPIQVPPFFEEIYGSFEPIAVAKGLGFSLQMKGESYKVYMGDSVRIRQIVGNLINNALKFTQKGSVSILVDCGGLALEKEIAEPVKGKKEILPSQLIITVRDTGSGIAEEERQRIFKEFTRITGSEKVEGFGLGLSITSRLVALLGGSVTVESELGVGTDFIVTLPLALAENQSLPNQQEADVPVEEKNWDADVMPTCLVVDDDLLQIALIEEVLKQCHVQVISSTDPSNVEEILRKSKVDLILSDVQMPGMNGIEMIRQLRQSDIPHAADIPVIVISGSVDLEGKEFINAGFTDALGKPFTIDQLIGKINKYIPCCKNKQRSLAGEGGTEAKPVGVVDFSALTEFASGDEEASSVIIQTFFEETRRSLQIFRDALVDTDRETVAKMAHRMIPLFSMLQAETIVQQLRILQLNTPEMTDSGWKRLMQDVIEQVGSIVDADEKA
ncbi:response regulator [Parabacteroides sp. OttesenSCG-928-J18]|nr:response regulator [Parabacteroides sp. OttesenSCG-928-J18]